ncbi:MAG: hypothetical protein GX185_04750 [Tissierellia bacterium]|nr:hypothetical protein [Tissierellia bacterium]
MYSGMLINKTDPKDNSNIKKRIFFIIGGMDKIEVENRLIRLLNKSKLLDLKDIMYKYNGVELNITTQQIPKFVRLFTENNIDIYGIYEIYNPKI